MKATGEEIAESFTNVGVRCTEVISYTFRLIYPQIKDFGTFLTAAQLGPKVDIDISRK